jgi:hypothetical protein
MRPRHGHAQRQLKRHSRVGVEKPPRLQDLARRVENRPLQPVDHKVHDLEAVDVVAAPAGHRMTQRIEHCDVEGIPA